MSHPTTSQPIPPSSANPQPATSSTSPSTSPPDEQEFGLLIATITNSTGWFITAESRPLVQPLNFAGFKDELREKGFRWAVSPVSVPRDGRGKKLVATHLKDKEIEDVWLLMRQMEEGVSVLRTELVLKERVKGKERLLSRVAEEGVRRLFAKIGGEVTAVVVGSAEAQVQKPSAKEGDEMEILALNESERERTSLILPDAEGRIKMDGDIEMKDRDLEEDELKARLLATKVETEKGERAKLRGQADELADSRLRIEDPHAVETPKADQATLRERHAKFKAELAELRSKRQEAIDKGLKAQETRFQKEIDERRETLKQVERLYRKAAKDKNNGNAVAQAQKTGAAQPEKDEMAKLQAEAAKLRPKILELKSKIESARKNGAKESEIEFQKEINERRRVLNLVVREFDEGKKSGSTAAQPGRSEKSKLHEQAAKLKADMSMLGRKLVEARAKGQKMEEVRLLTEIDQRQKALANLGHAARKADESSSTGSSASHDQGFAQRKEERQQRMRQDVKGVELKRKAPNEGSSSGSSMKKQKLGGK